MCADRAAHLLTLAAACASRLAKAHQFTDDNRRTAFLASVIFLGLNGKDLDATETEVVHVTTALRGGLTDRSRDGEVDSRAPCSTQAVTRSVARSRPALAPTGTSPRSPGMNYRGPTRDLPVVFPGEMPNTSAPPGTASSAPPPVRRVRTIVRASAASFAAWTLVFLLHAVAGYTDQVRRGRPAGFGDLLGSMALAYLPWVVLSAALYLVLDRESHRLTDPRHVARRFLQSIGLFLLPETAYQVAISLPADGTTFFQAVARWPALLWFIDLALLVATFTAVYALVAVRASLAARFRQQRTDAEILTLRLDLEQQRLRALRAQLEPHFVFNALNAISSLVRGESRPLALTALGQLSGLLRYALTASNAEWVTLADELRFVREYLALQRLRYGDRLQLSIGGDDDHVTGVDCPPLLLQPLVENAIRHDLERHDGPSDIRLTFASDGPMIVIHVSNSTHPEAPPNPGLGLGLRATRDRLALAYRGRARFEARPAEGRFEVTLTIPRAASD